MGDNSARTVGSGELVRTKSRGGTAPNEIKTAITMIDINKGGAETLVDGALPVEPRVTSTVPGHVALTASTDSQVVFALNSGTGVGGRLGVALINLGTTSYIRVAYADPATAANTIERVPPGFTWHMDEPINTAVVACYWEDTDGAGDGAIGVEYRR